MAKLVQIITGPDRVQKAEILLEREKARTGADGWVNYGETECKVFIDTPGPAGPVAG